MKTTDETSTDGRMKSNQTVLFGDSRSIPEVAADSVDLVVTSPPYPMIAMWDGVFVSMSPAIGAALDAGDGQGAFDLMHGELDKVWRECYRVLKPGSIACINIGDAVRTVGGDFRLFSNHGRIISAMLASGFTPLPDIIWRKPANSPTKFMGSGMLPAGAYVTYEHEYILVFRKGLKRSFASDREKQNRRRSAFFWEERNNWFSDVWTDLRGTGQGVEEAETRDRSAAFPFELAYRLVCMYSVYSDTVLDPFLGTGTTLAATTAAGRSGLGVEVDRGFSGLIERVIEEALGSGATRIKDRLHDHTDFIEARRTSGAKVGHWNGHHQFPVMSAQEKEIRLYYPSGLARTGRGRFEVDYAPVPAADHTFEPVVSLTPEGERGQNGTLW